MISDKIAALYCARIYDDAQNGNWAHLQPDNGAYWAADRWGDDSWIIVCRGSITLLDWADDIDFTPTGTRYGTQHAGFWQGLPQHSPGGAALAIDKVNAFTKGAPISHIVGHSLGAAHAVQMARVLSAQRHTLIPWTVFGLPRPGFADFCTACPPGRWYRNREDRVTFVPPAELGYRQPGTMVSIDESPTGDLIDRWGPFSSHHIDLYVKGAAS